MFENFIHNTHKKQERALARIQRKNRKKYYNKRIYWKRDLMGEWRLWVIDLNPIVEFKKKG